MKILTAFLLVALVACAPHKIRYYQLSALAAGAGGGETGPSIVVGTIATPQALQDGRIRYLEGSNEVGTYEYHRWTNPPGMMVRESLIRTLRASGKFGTVQEAGSLTTGDYSIRGKLVEFAEVDKPGVHTRVTLDLEMREIKSGKLVWNRLLTRDEPATAKVVSDVVRSLDLNLQAVLKEAVGGVEGYLRERK